VTSRLPGGSCFRKFQNVDRCIQIAIVMLFAFLAIELADIERHFRMDMAAGTASLRGGEEPICHSDFLPIPSGFVFQHRAKPYVNTFN